MNIGKAYTYSSARWAIVYSGVLLVRKHADWYGGVSESGLHGEARGASERGAHYGHGQQFGRRPFQIDTVWRVSRRHLDVIYWQQIDAESRFRGERGREGEERSCACRYRGRPPMSSSSSRHVLVVVVIVCRDVYKRQDSTCKRVLYVFEGREILP